VVARSASNRLSAMPAPSTCHAGHVLGEAFQRNGPKVAILEQATCEPPCARCNHDCAWLRQRLEASGKVRRLSDHRLLLCRSCSDQVADHNEAGRDADTNLQGRTGIRGKLRNRLDQTEPGANSALSIMFMRLGVAEIGENAVAHVFGDKPAIALDEVGAAAMIAAYNPTQVFGVKLA